MADKFSTYAYVNKPSNKYDGKKFHILRSHCNHIPLLYSGQLFTDDGVFVSCAFYEDELESAYAHDTKMFGENSKWI